MMNQGEVKRGKHAKIRKMKEKYADQDEEDRQMRMALIGSKKVEGFDITKHQQYKHGKLMGAGEQPEDDDAEEEEEEKEEVQQEGEEENPNEASESNQNAEEEKKED